MLDSFMSGNYKDEHFYSERTSTFGSSNDLFIILAFILPILLIDLELNYTLAFSELEPSDISLFFFRELPPDK